MMNKIFLSEMQIVFPSVLILTILLAIGLVFFLRAASKDRTTIVDVHSPLPALQVLEGISDWLEERGWKRDGGDAINQVLCFNGSVASSLPLQILLTILGGFGSGSLGLVLKQLYPNLNWWPLLLIVLGGPLAGFVYRKRAARVESLEVKLVSFSDQDGSRLRLRAHRDELIAIELELSESLKLASDGKLLSSPI